MSNTNKNTDALRFKISLFLSIIFVATMWIIKFFELTLDFNLVEYGVYPRTLSGLKGILFSPFIHGSLEHLFSNTFPFLILFGSLIFFYPKKYFKIFGLIYFFSGLILFGIGRPSYHIGASGLVYALASFHFFSGALSRKNEFIAISLIVIFLYGGIIWGVFPNADTQISWEAHLAGFVVGAFLSIIYYPRDIISKQKSKDIDLNNNFVYFYDFKTINSTTNNKLIYKSNNKESDNKISYQINTYEKIFDNNSITTSNFRNIWTS